jgi:hypothetical protein
MRGLKGRRGKKMKRLDVTGRGGIRRKGWRVKGEGAVDESDEG